MQMKRGSKLTSLILCIVLIVAIALNTTGCNGSTGKDTSSGSGTGADLQAESNVSEEEADAHTDERAQEAGSDVNVLGTGSTEFSLTVIDQEGNETPFEIHTDKETVGDALLELGLIDGEESEYGLYVKTVNGITADYDTNGTYWAFYINGEYASSGVDSTEITVGESYSFKVE